VREAAEIEIFGSHNAKDQRPYFAKSCAPFGLATASESRILLRHHLRHISPDEQADNAVVKCILEQGMYVGSDGCGNRFRNRPSKGRKPPSPKGCAPAIWQACRKKYLRAALEIISLNACRNKEHANGGLNG
jgi:hypothetical protein